MKEQNTWLTKEQLAYLFSCDTKTIDSYLKEAKNEELSSIQVQQIFKNKSTLIEYYPTEVLFSIGFRIHNEKGVRFRKWATKELMKKQKE